MSLEPPKPDFDDPEEEFEKDLTFEEICPVWSDRIRNWDRLSFEEQHYLKSILKLDGTRCFLGEAWGWNNNWGRKQYDGAVCGQCRDFGEVNTPNSMVLPFLTFVSGLVHGERSAEIFLENFEKRKSEFVDHWNKYHRRFIGGK